MGNLIFFFLILSPSSELLFHWFYFSNPEFLFGPFLKKKIVSHYVHLVWYCPHTFLWLFIHDFFSSLYIIDHPLRPFLLIAFILMYGIFSCFLESIIQFLLKKKMGILSSTKWGFWTWDSLSRACFAAYYGCFGFSVFSELILENLYCWSCVAVEVSSCLNSLMMEQQFLGIPGASKPPSICPGFSRCVSFDAPSVHWHCSITFTSCRAEPQGQLEVTLRVFIDFPETAHISACVCPSGFLGRM